MTDTVMNVAPPAVRLAAAVSLPFALSKVAPPAEPAMSSVMQRLNSLHELARETKAQMEALRMESSQILQALTARPPASPLAERQAVPGSSARPEATLSFHLFGSFEVRAAGGAVREWRSKKARSILAYLAMEPRRRVPKDVLVELFWPDSPVARGSNNLSIAIYQIRSALKGLLPPPGHGISVQQGLYSLDPDLVCWIDVNEFNTRVSAAWQAAHTPDKEPTRRHLEAAVSLIRGPFLEHDLYEEWTIEPRRAFDAAFGRALAWLAADAAGLGDWMRLADYATRMIGRDPCDEEGHRWLMRAHWRLGNRARALMQFRVCAQRLQEELGVSPSTETLRLLRAIRDDDASPGP